MNRTKPEPPDRPKHADVQRDAMEDIKDLQPKPGGGRNEVRYREPNRDRALGEADRTGRHFDEISEEPTIREEPNGGDEAAVDREHGSGQEGETE